MASTNPTKLDSALGKFLPNMPNKTNAPAATTTEIPGQSPNASKPSIPATKAVPKKTKVTIQDYHILATLGTGSFGRVHLVRSKADNKFSAMKVLRKNDIVKLRQVEHTINEKQILEQLDMPFLVRMNGTFQDSNCLFLLLEYIQGGELFSYLRRSGVISFLFLLRNFYKNYF
jgi:protein kinase A